jgi:hypothetical protein
MTAYPDKRVPAPHVLEDNMLLVRSVSGELGSQLFRARHKTGHRFIKVVIPVFYVSFVN